MKSVELRQKIKDDIKGRMIMWKNVFYVGFLFLVTLLIPFSNVSAQISIDTDYTGMYDYYSDVWTEGFAQAGYTPEFHAALKM